jgi:predicted GNAT family acetyltransferase
MRKRDEPKYVISISLEVEHHQILREMATQRGLFISNGSKKGEPNVSGLIKKITEEYKMYIYIQESRACEYAKEIFAKMVELGSIKNWTHWMSDQSLSKELMKEAVKACHLSNEFLEDQELYEGDIQKLIENCPD